MQDVGVHELEGKQLPDITLGQTGYAEFRIVDDNGSCLRQQVLHDESNHVKDYQQQGHRPSWRERPAAHVSAVFQHLNLNVLASHRFFNALLLSRRKKTGSRSRTVRFDNETALLTFPRGKSSAR